MSDRPHGSDRAPDEAAPEGAGPGDRAFPAPCEPAPVYAGFPIIRETATDGWYYGAITEFILPDAPEGCDSGDGFVVAPDGSRAGLVWEVGTGEIEEILPPEEGRWGVWAVWFPRPVRTVEDLVFNFRAVLPQLQRRFADVRRRFS